MSRLLSLVVLGLCAATVAAGDLARRPGGASAEDPPDPSAYGFLTHGLLPLSENPQDWYGTQFESGLSLRHLVTAGAFDPVQEPLGLEEFGWGLNAVYPITDYTAIGEFSHTRWDALFPAGNTHLQMGQDLGGGFGILAGIRQLKYPESLVHVGDFTLERYFGNFRAAYSAFPSFSDATGDALSHRLQLAHYLSGGSEISFAFSTGSGMRRPFDATSVVETGFTRFSLWGKVRLTPALGLTWSTDYTDVDEQGGQDADRTGFNLGLEYDF